LHDIEDYHITPEQAARVANDAGVELLVVYHLLPAPDGLLPRRVFGQGVNGSTERRLDDCRRRQPLYAASRIAGSPDRPRERLMQ
jgi:ribonuclease BN (tRNA processing enzyme)